MKRTTLTRSDAVAMNLAAVPERFHAVVKELQGMGRNVYYRPPMSSHAAQIVSVLRSDPALAKKDEGLTANGYKLVLA